MKMSIPIVTLTAGLMFGTAIAMGAAAQGQKAQTANGNRLLTGASRPAIAGAESLKIYENKYGFIVSDADGDPDA